MTALVTGTLDGGALLHLRCCAACRKEWRRLYATLTGMAAQIHNEARRSEAFFQVQRAQVIRRLGEQRPRAGRWRMAWAPALAAALMVVFFTREGAPPPAPRASETDQAFLTAVEHAIGTEMPGALRPAALLVAEVERVLPQMDDRMAVPKGEQP